MYRRKTKTKKSNGPSDCIQLSLPFQSDDCYPAAGNRNGTSLNNAGTNGNYWSSTLNSSNESNAYNLNFNSSNINPSNNNNRYNGFSVRPVSELVTTKSAGISPFHLTKEQLLTDLITAYHNARSNKRKTNSQIEFEMLMEKGLTELRDAIYNQTYTPGRSKCFVIHDPKLREIFAADFKDRVVHHLFFNYTSPLFERLFINDSYSCRKGKGSFYGIQRLQHFLLSCTQNYHKPCYILKMDIKGYFMNINRCKLLQIILNDLDRMKAKTSCYSGKKWVEVIDYEIVTFLATIIVMNDPLENCQIKGDRSEWDSLPTSKSLFTTSEGCGLPIGNLTSQLFSNVYLNCFDQYMKRTLGCKYYGRYVDDSFVLSDNHARLEEIKRKAEHFLSDELDLQLNRAKTTIVSSNYGVEFLGCYIKPYRSYIRSSTMSRMATKYQGVLTNFNPVEYRNSVNSFFGLMGHYSSYKLRKSLIDAHDDWHHIGYFNGKLTKFVLYDNSFIKWNYVI